MSGWQEQHAAALEHMAGELGKALMELDNLEEILEVRGRPGLLSECRGFAGGVRAELNTMAAEARALRAGDPDTVLPMSLTTRRTG